VRVRHSHPFPKEGKGWGTHFQISPQRKGGTPGGKYKISGTKKLIEEFQPAISSGLLKIVELNYNESDIQQFHVSVPDPPLPASGSLPIRE
jgi:hypothetical protein